MEFTQDCRFVHSGPVNQFSLIFFCQRSGLMRVSTNLGLKRGLSKI